MTSGYQVNGSDLDAIFAPTHAGWAQAAATGYQVNGVDLATRYALLSAGSAAAATGYDKAGADLNTLFAAIGSTGVQVGMQPSAVSGSSAAGNPSGTVTSGTATCAGAKGSGTYTYTWHTTGCTATNPNSASTTFSAIVNAASTDNATAYCTINDGVSSVNTSVIPVTLTNTSPAQFTSNFSGVAGQRTVGASDVLTGYDSQMGSIVGAGLTGGNTIVTVETRSTTNDNLLSISGFAADPGSSFLVSVTVNGTTYQGANGTYTYLNGVASWTWGIGTYGSFGMSLGQAYNGSITYK